MLVVIPAGEIVRRRNLAEPGPRKFNLRHRVFNSWVPGLAVKNGLPGMTRFISPRAWRSGGLRRNKGRGGEASISLMIWFGCSLRHPAPCQPRVHVPAQRLDTVEQGTP